MAASPYDFYKFAVLKSNKELFEQSVSRIIKLITENKPIPYKTLLDCINLTYKSDYATTEDFVKSYTTIATNATNYFRETNRGSYNFEGRVKIPENSKKSYKTYSLHDLFYYSVKKYFEKKEHPMFLKADVVLHFFYKEILIYKKTLFSVKDKKRCTHYKMCVIAAYLTILVGHKVTNKKKFSNWDMFQSSKDTLRIHKRKSRNKAAL